MEQISHLALLVVFAELPTAALLASAQVCRRWRDVLADPARWAHVDYLDKWAYLKAACRGDSPPAVQLAISRFQIGAAKMRHHLLKHVGRLEVGKWMAPQCNLTLADLRRGRMVQLEDACLKGRFDYARWLLDTFGVERKDIFDDGCYSPGYFGGVFAASCSRGDGRSLVEHLIGRYNVTADDLFRNCAVVLSAAAAGGNFEWLLDRMNVVLTSTHKEALYYLCNDTGVDTLAKILDRMDFGRSDCVELLSYACRQSSIDAAQLLLRRYGITQSDLKSWRQRCPLTEACERGDVRLATWLVDTAGICTIKDRLRHTLYNVCTKGHSDMLEWLAERAGAKTIAEWISYPHLNVVFVAIRNGNIQLFQRLIELAKVTASELRNCIPINGGSWSPGATDSTIAFQKLFELAEVTRADLVAWKWSVLFDICHHDNLPLLKWFVNKFKPTVGDIRTKRSGSGNTNTCLAVAMVMGAHDTARWLIARFGLGLDDICVADEDDSDDEEDGYVEDDIDYPRDATLIDRMFDTAVDGEWLWVFDYFELTAKQITPNIFRKACAQGYLRSARAVAAAVRPTSEEASFALCAAEADGHDDVATWLRDEFSL
jgi:hypothetical protein